jgi:hypothetical protein
MMKRRTVDENEKRQRGTARGVYWLCLESPFSSLAALSFSSRVQKQWGQEWQASRLKLQREESKGETRIYHLHHHLTTG